MSHFIEKCKHGTVGGQCRCPDLNKREERILCPPHCSGKDEKSSQQKSDIAMPEIKNEELFTALTRAIHENNHQYSSSYAVECANCVAVAQTVFKVLGPLGLPYARHVIDLARHWAEKTLYMDIDPASHLERSLKQAVSLFEQNFDSDPRIPLLKEFLEKNDTSGQSSDEIAIEILKVLDEASESDESTAIV